MAQTQQQLRRRRRRAVRLFEQGASQADVARRLGVSRQAASVWWRTFTEQGAEELAEPGQAGRPSRLDASQLGEVEAALLSGPRAWGYATEIWTLPRITKLIREVTGVRYHPGHVWKIMKRLGWSLQRPTTRARERNEQDIAHWVKSTWPQLKKTPRGGARRSSSSTRAASPSGRQSDARGRRGGRRPS